MIKYNNKIWILIIAFLVWSLFVKNEMKINKLQRDGKEVRGYVFKKIKVGASGSVRCYYSFQVNGVNYSGFYSNDFYNVGDSISILYYPNDPNINHEKKFVDEN